MYNRFSHQKTVKREFLILVSNGFANVAEQIIGNHNYKQFNRSSSITVLYDKIQKLQKKSMNSKVLEA